MTTPRARPTGSDAAGTARRHVLGAGLLPTRWTLWSLRPPALAYVLVIDLLALATVAVEVGVHPPTAQDWRVCSLLFAGSVLHAEAVRHIERVRISPGDKPFIDLKSMWTFAAVLLVGVGSSLVLVTAVFAYWWVRNERRPPPHRWVFSWSTVVLGSAAAGALLDGVHLETLLQVAAGPSGLGIIALAGVVRWTVNHGLVVGIIRLVSPTTSIRSQFTSASDTLLGLGALALGAALAVLGAASPWLVPILLVPVIVLHRGVLVDQFRHAARTDPKTGLANAPAWAEIAAKELARTRRHAAGLAVLMVDLDEFKAVNDRHGHLVGDEVLREVATVLSTEVRAYDAVGRFGGEEFLVLLSGVDAHAATLTAERLRARIGSIDLTVAGPRGIESRVRGLTASVGCAPCPATGSTVDDLVATADAALYRAKREGRDRTVTTLPV